MSVNEAVLNALFCMSVVFIVLIALWGAIKLFSLVIAAIHMIEHKNRERR